MTTPVLAVEDFGLWVLERDARRNILSYPQSLMIHEPGVYTIEGDNLAGKSTLVKMIMGALPTSVQEERPRITIKGQEVHIGTVRDAYYHGLAAVFQDDSLVATMTVRDQILMRHANPSLLDIRNWTWNLVLEHILHTPLAVAKHVGLSIGRLAAHATERETYVEDRARLLLASYGSAYAGILELYPAQLSGGATAVAKLLNAQLTDKVSILILDEAFAGVQRSVRPRLIDDLKRWAEQEQSTIIAVSHDSDELMRWQPKRRFLISEGHISEIPPRGYTRLQPGIPQRISAFPIYVGPSSAAHEWLQYCEPPYWLIMDRTVANTLPGTELVAEVEKRDASFGAQRLTLLDLTERRKTLETYVGLLREGAELLPPGKGTIIVAGGGITLNLGAFVASTLHRGRSPHVLVPTTVMAVADVAVGSKTGLNYLSQVAAPRKHVIGTYANPAAVVVDQRFLASLPGHEKKLGLVECLKHGLTEDRALYDEIDYLLGAADPDRARCFAAAWHTLELKSRLLALDPWEDSIGGLLLFGHAHASALEVASEFAVPHGLAVLWGMLLDLRLAGSRELYDSLVMKERTEWRLFDAIQPRKVGMNELRAAYTATAGPNGIKGALDLISVTAIAQYAAPHEGVQTSRIPLTNVFQTIPQLRTDLGVEGGFLT